MTTETEKVVQAAMRLPRESRAFLAEKLLESIDQGEEFEVSPLWLEEIRKRCRELDDAKVDLIPADQVFDEINREFE